MLLRSLLRPLSLSHPVSHPLLPSHASLRFLSTPSWLVSHTAAPQGGAAMPPDLPTRHRRIIYRSRQRGWLELDVLLGAWAAKYVPTFANAAPQLAMVEHLLDADTPDVLKWVLGQKETPPEFDNEVMHSIKAYAQADGHVSER